VGGSPQLKDSSINSTRSSSNALHKLGSNWIGLISYLEANSIYSLLSTPCNNKDGISLSLIRLSITQLGSESDRNVGKERKTLSPRKKKLIFSFVLVVVIII
jgi:hypothetical protein